MAGLSGMSGTGSMNSRFDIANRYTDVNGEDYSAYVNRWEEEEKLKKLYEDKGTLSFEDMLQLMIAQFQNQTIDNQADTNDMMNQLVSMSTMQAMNEMTDQMKELTLANVMSYAASLVGQEVTLGVGYDEKGNIIEKVGTVEAMGTYNGQTVIFVDGKSYYLSSIMAVGRLPDKTEAPEDPENPDGEEDVPVPPIKDDEAVDDPDPEYNGENGADEE